MALAIGATVRAMRPTTGATRRATRASFKSDDSLDDSHMMIAPKGQMFVKID